MTTGTPLRTHLLGLLLRNDEALRIAADARALGVSQAEALRRACPKYFTEPVRQGRRAGESPWRLPTPD